MSMPAPQTVTTIEELLALPEDGLRHELLDGEHVMTPAPSVDHQRVLGPLSRHLADATADHPDLEALTSPADIRLGPRTLVQPDLFIVVSDPDHRFRDWADAPIPLLAVEILSPSTAARDRGQKRRLYLEAGVEEYWIVDLDARLVERWRRGDVRPEIVEDRLDWRIGEAGGSLQLESVFRVIG